MFPALILGQEIPLRRQIDSIVSSIDVKVINIKSFSKEESGTLKQKRVVKYQFGYVDGEVEYIVRKIADRDSSVKQVFYTKNSSLIFATEQIAYYYGRDSVMWGGSYYFSKGKLKYEETLGHGKSEQEAWNPEIEVVGNYQ